MGGRGGVGGWQRKKKGRDSVSEWDVWHAAEFFDLAGPGTALALKYRQQWGRDGKEEGRDHVWKKEGGIALLHLTRQVNWALFFSRRNYNAVLPGIAHVVLPLANTLLWIDGWRRGEERLGGRWKCKLGGLAKWAESKWCWSTLADSMAPLITFNQSFVESAGQTPTVSHLLSSIAV